MEAINETYGDIEDTIGSALKSGIEKAKPVLEVLGKPAELVKKGYEKSPLGMAV